MDTNEGLGQWFVPISGDSLELDKFAEFLSEHSKRYEIIKEGAGYIFTASQFAQLHDPAAVIIEARKVIPQLKGRAKLKRLEVSSIKVSDAVRRTIGTHVYVYAYETVTLEALESSEAHMTDVSTGEEAVHKKLHSEKYLEHLDDVADDPRISRALKYFSLQSSWPTLYKAYQSIWPTIAKNKHDGEKIIREKGWATSDELDRFGYFANWYDSSIKD